jgi:exopolyphosphatase/guanosine-5'-triphosphate,3'-diphosphate pyrophosphatase
MTPRYEYRVWAQDLDQLKTRLAMHCEPFGERVSRETYVVLEVDFNVKIRSEILDVKQLMRTQQGFQLWTPILKEAFPLPTPTARDVLAKLTGLNPPIVGGEALKTDRFLALAEETGAAVASVHKQRHGYLLEGCILEVALVTIDGFSLHTVAVESEDLDNATMVADRLGINDLPNQSYPAAIRQALGM